MLLVFLLALPDIPEEDRLLAQARRGNQKAIGTIYEQYFDPLYRFIRWRVDDEAQAEDLTSEVFISFLNALQTQNAPSQSLRGWLFRVARNVLYDHAHRSIKTTELDEELHVSADAEADMMQAFDIERVRQALQTLATDQQEVLILRFGEMQSLEDTAESMGRSISAIKSLQFRAISTLRQRLAHG